MNAAVEPDCRADVVAYLDRRRCAACRTSLSAVGIADITRSSNAPKFRCWPPHPTCWELRCSGCAQYFLIAVRTGKSWPITGEVTRRCPRPRTNGSA
jgi:hypothetical protein